MAVTLTLAELRQTHGAGIEGEKLWPDALLQEMLDAATAAVEEYAEGAPVAIQNQAARRYCRWLANQGATIDTDAIVAASGGASGPLRASGGMAMLAHWRRHRARQVTG